MEIKKVLKVESAVHLFRVIENNSDVIELLGGESGMRIEYYQSVAAEYLYGCKCQDEENWERLSAEYETLRADSGLLADLCRVLGCDRIDFET